ncbi:MAG: Coq4 family protein [Parvularculaceae bacterium]
MKQAPIEISAEDLVYVEGFATPPSPEFRPLHALVSAVKLILNKDDTRQVFEVVTALSKDSSRRLFEKFVSTPYGRRVAEGEVKLEEILGDFASLRTYPEGSFGKAYVDFMDEAGFTPQGLIDAADEAGVGMEDYPELDAFRRVFTHLEVSHDLWHVITGYSRDPVGEICNLVFTRRQTGNPGLRLIVFMGLSAIKLERWSMPILKAARQAAEMGDKVDFLLQHDVEALLKRPLAEVRADLGFIEPTVYDAIPYADKHSVLRPKVKATQSEREQTKGLAQAA